MNSRVPLIVAAVMAVVAVVLLIACAVIVAQTRAFLADSLSANGTVTALVPRQS